MTEEPHGDEVEATEEEEDPLRLARLAIFCSVFGAAILLGLTLSIARQQPPAKLSQKRYVEISVAAIRDENGQVPLLNFYVVTPDGVKSELPLEALASATLRPAHLGRSTLERLESAGTFLAPGLSYFGEVHSADRSPPAAGPQLVGDSHGQLEILNPKPGPWYIAIRCHGAMNRDLSKPFQPRCRLSVAVAGESYVPEREVPLMSPRGFFISAPVWPDAPDPAHPHVIK
jgi:hypothetical protein